VSSAKSLEDKIKELCKDPEYAMALFLRAPIPSHRYEDIQRNAELYGLDKKKLNEVLNIINSLEKGTNSNNEFDEIMKGVASECIEKSSAELENISRKRIEKLQDSEINALRYASYIIKSLMSPYFKDKIFRVVSVGKDELIKSLCATLQVDHEDAKKFAEFLAKIGIAFYYFDKIHNRSYYEQHYNYIVPLYAVKIIDEYSKEIEDKIKKSVDMIRNLNDTKFLSALLNALGLKEDFFAFIAVYGVGWDDYLRTVKLPDICYYGCVNYSIRNLIGNIIIDIAKSRFEKIYKAIEKVLKENGFEIIEPKFSKLDYNKTYPIVAVKPAQYRFAIYIMPFPQNIPPPYEEKEVIIVEGPVAQLDYFKAKKIKMYELVDRNFVIVEMDKNLDNVIAVIDNVKADWSRELTEIFKSLNITTSSSSIITSPSQSPPLTAPSTAISSTSSTSIPISSLPLYDKDIFTKIKRFQARDILESVVGAALEDLGFEPKVDVQVPTKDGANIEVDVWALKTTSGVEFRIYVSCKNLNNDIGTPIIHQESGRTDQLQKAPHMKFIVASKFNDQAKKIAIANGFIPIEIGFKVDDSNVIGAYKKVYETMNEIFSALAPKRLQQLAKHISKVYEELRKISDELGKLASSSQPST